MTQGLTDDSFKYHLISAKANGITKDEIAEIITQLLFMQDGLRLGLCFAWLRKFGTKKQI